MIPLRPLIHTWIIVASIGGVEGRGQCKRKKGRLAACRPLEKPIGPEANLRYLLPMFRPVSSACGVDALK